MNIVLGIETSCDETGIAIYSANKGLIAHHVYSQIDLHQAYGGVVPELASRDHVRKTLPLIELSLKEAAINKSDLDGIAYTKGPGLIGALMVGASVAKGLAYALDIPVIGVHHLEAHLMAVMLTDKPPAFPFLTLLVSGGHTLLIAVERFGSYNIIGESLDDAAGEAFDKTAKLLGLPYPGGPHLAKLAEQGDSNRFTFPRPMLHSNDLNFSFSGLKTHAVTTFQKEKNKANIAAAFEDAVVDVLFKKTKKALEQTGYDRCVVAGGVAANKKLRALLSEKLNAEVFYPPHELCTDNGAMVAYTGYLHLNNNEVSDLAVDVFPRLPITSEPRRASDRQF